MKHIVLIVAVCASLLAFPASAKERWQLARAEQIAADRATLTMLREDPISVTACECRDRWNAIQDIYFAVRTDKPHLAAIGTTKQELEELRTREAASLFRSTWTAANTDPSALQCFKPHRHWIEMREVGVYALLAALDAIESMGISPTALGIDAGSFRAVMVREAQKLVDEAARRVAAASASYEAEAHAICYVNLLERRWDIPGFEER